MQYGYGSHDQNNEDIYIAAKQCSQYTIGTTYIEAGDVLRYRNFEGEETTLEWNQQRLVKKPGYEILLFDIDDVSFSIENDFIYMHVIRNRQNYTFLLTYASLWQEEGDNNETLPSDIQE
nr:competence type IV pilus minor pilin ComGF [Allocoprobacillus halotolerans]